MPVVSLWSKGNKGRDDKDVTLTLTVHFGSSFPKQQSSSPPCTTGRVWSLRQTLSPWCEVLATATPKVYRCITPSYVQLVFSATAPVLESRSLASLLQYFEKKGLSLYPVACTIRFNLVVPSLSEHRDQFSNNPLAWLRARTWIQASHSPDYPKMSLSSL